jgi:hypothetical protein
MPGEIVSCPSQHDCSSVSGNFAALLTEAVEIRAEGVSREMLLPQARGEEVHFKGGMGIDALEHINQVNIRIHVSGS